MESFFFTFFYGHPVDVSQSSDFNHMWRKPLYIYWWKIKFTSFVALEKTHHFVHLCAHLNLQWRIPKTVFLDQDLYQEIKK